MSGNGTTTYCPNCGEQAYLYTDHKPFDYATVECLNCGFHTQIQAGYMSLQDLNDMREQEDMKPLDKLPEQNPDFIWRVGEV